MSSIARRPDGRWRARYRDAAGKEHAKHFPTKRQAQDWLDAITASVVDGRYVDPQKAKTTVAQWCETWLSGYAGRPRSVRQAQVHTDRIVAEFGPCRLGAVQPSAIRTWTVRLAAEGLSASYIYALHGRLARIMADAVRDGLLAKSPCGRETAPPMGEQVPYVATTGQVWELHDAMPERLRPAVLLAAFAGLRLAESCGLRTADVNYLRHVITPAVQYPADPLKSRTSRQPVPVPRELTAFLSSHAAAYPGTWVLCGRDGGQLHPAALERAMRTARRKVPGLPEGFRYHDLRHYFASLLIAEGCDIKTVQARLRHKSAVTTMDTYGHLFDGKDEHSRAAVGSAFRDPADSSRTVRSAG